MPDYALCEYNEFYHMGLFVPLCQFMAYLIPGEVLGDKQHKQVVDEIGAFFDDALVALALVRQNHLNRFFPNFFDDLVLVGE